MHAVARTLTSRVAITEARPRVAAMSRNHRLGGQVAPRSTAARGSGRAVDKRWTEELIAGAETLEDMERAVAGTADTRWRILG